MGRRSQHTPEELRELILDATRRVVEVQGFHALSAREIAREIKYAPGTLYNMFSNLDEILLRVEARVLEELDEGLAKAIGNKRDAEAVRRFAAAYVDFAFEHPRLWSLVQQHSLLDSKPAPSWFLERLYAPLSRLELVIGAMLEDADADEVSRSARMIWTAIYGALKVATTDKYGPLPATTTLNMVDTLVVQLCASITSPSPGSSRRKERLAASTNGKRERQHT